jgi:hypothetical protein
MQTHRQQVGLISLLLLFVQNKESKLTRDAKLQGMHLEAVCTPN